MSIGKFFLAVIVLGLMGGCGESWQEPTTVSLIGGKTVLCEKGMYLDTNVPRPVILCYGEQNVTIKIPWKEVSGLRKDTANITTAK